MRIIEPNYYFDGTYVFPKGITRTYQALFLASIIITGIADYENIIVGEICSGLAENV